MSSYMIVDSNECSNNSCSSPQGYFQIKNLFNELKTEVDKANARHNLGIGDQWNLKWGNITGFIEEQKDLTQYLDNFIIAYKQETQQAIINTNRIANGAVTIPKLSTDIQALIANLSKNALFAGMATPTTNPGTPDGPVFYIVAEPGVYSNFSNITIDNNQLCVLMWNNGSWSKELMAEINPYTSISGVLNLTSSTCISSLPSMNENELRLYIAGDSNGNYPAKNGNKYVKVHDSVKLANFLNTDQSLYVNVGDIIAVIGNKTSLGITKVCRVIPLNDAKAGLTDGIMTKGDKTTLTNLGYSITELESLLVNRVALKSYSESNMNNALESGVYPWCTLGRPAGSTGAYTCVVLKSFDADGGGYYTIEQTAYGREGELGQVYKRIIFQKNDGSDTQYGEWIRVSGGGGFAKQYEVSFTFGNLGEDNSAEISIAEDVFRHIRDISLHCNLSEYPRISVKGSYEIQFLGRPNYLYKGAGNTDLSWEVVDRNGWRYILVLYYEGSGSYKAKFLLIK